MSRLRVLAFAPSLGGGGAEMHLLRLLNHFDRTRIEPQLALARPGGSYETRLAGDVPVHHLIGGPLRSSLVRIVRAYRPLRDLIRREHPDVVLSVLNHANAVAVAATRAAGNGTRIVVSEQNPPRLNFPGRFSPPDRLFRAATRRYYPRADAVIALSHGTAEDLIALVPELAGRVQVIPNAGLDATVLQGATQPLPADAVRPGHPLVVACGRLVEQKAFHVFIEACALARRTTPFTAWIVGDGPLKGELAALIARRGVADTVRLVGFRANPFAFMAAADVFVLSSAYEGFGNVLVEAMACGAPVIATDCPHGPREILQGGADGVLVPVGDAGALAHALVRLLADPAERRRLAAAGRVRAAAFEATRIAALYGSALAAVRP